MFAAGNLLHAAETADAAALSGRHVAAGVLRHLAGAPWPAAPAPLECAAPLHWVARDRGGLLLRARRELVDARVEAVQDGRALWQGRLPRVHAGRSVRMPSSWLAGADRAGGPVVLRVRRARVRG